MKLVFKEDQTVYIHGQVYKVALYSKPFNYETSISDKPLLKEDKRIPEYGSVLAPLELGVYNKLLEWRNKRASQLRIPPFIICSNQTLSDLCKSISQGNWVLTKIKGWGDKKNAMFYKELFELFT